MKLTEDTSFHWSNYLKATPPTIYWLVTTAEAIVLSVNVIEIFREVNPWVITGLLVLQTFISKLKDFVGKIKDDYEKKITVQSETPITLKTEDGSNP